MMEMVRSSDHLDRLWTQNELDALVLGGVIEREETNRIPEFLT